MSETEQIDTLKALQTRIREATGPDRHLDVEIAKAFGLPQARKSNASIAVPRFTTYPDGLGACVGLLEAALPGKDWSRNGDRSFGIGDGGDLIADALPLANDCLTFLDAIFSALIAEIEAKQPENAT